MADRWRFNDRRRTVLRGIARLERNGADAAYVRTLRNLVNDSYLRSNKARGLVGRSPEVVSQSLREATQMIASYDLVGNSAVSANALFDVDFKSAARGGTSTMTRDDVSLFYASTKDIWASTQTRNVSKKERDRMIIDYINAHPEEFGGKTVGSLREAYETITNTEGYKNAMEKVRAQYEAGEIMDFYSEVVSHISGMFRE